MPLNSIVCVCVCAVDTHTHTQPLPPIGCVASVPEANSSVLTEGRLTLTCWDRSFVMRCVQLQLIERFPSPTEKERRGGRR